MFGAGTATAQSPSAFQVALFARGHAGFCCTLSAKSEDNRIAENPEGAQPANPLGFRGPMTPYQDDGDLGATVSIGGGLDAVLFRYAGLSLFVGAASLTLGSDETEPDRTWVLDVAAEPRVRFPFGDHEVFLKGSFGLVKPYANASIERDAMFKMTPVSGHSWALAIGGAHYVHPRVGLSWEVGYRVRSFGYDIAFDYEFSDLPTRGDVDLKVGQVFLSIGVLGRIWKSAIE